MAPEEKAEEIYKKMYTVHSNIYPSSAKQCALVAVGEILNEISPLDIHPLGTYTNPKIEYWQEVKQEIEKL